MARNVAVSGSHVFVVSFFSVSLFELHEAKEVDRPLTCPLRGGVALNTKNCFDLRQNRFL